MFTMRTIKRLLPAALMLLVAAPSFAQMVSNNNEDGVNKPTREARFRPYRKGQVTVKVCVPSLWFLTASSVALTAKWALLLLSLMLSPLVVL